MLMHLISAATSESPLAAPRPRAPTSGRVATRSVASTPPKLKLMGGGATGAKPACCERRLLTAGVGAEARLDDVTTAPGGSTARVEGATVVGFRAPARVGSGMAPKVDEETHLAPPSFKGGASVIETTVVAAGGVARGKPLPAIEPANGRVGAVEPSRAVPITRQGSRARPEPTVESPPGVHVTGGGDGRTGLISLSEGGSATTPKLMGPVALHTATPGSRRGATPRQVRVARLHEPAAPIYSDRVKRGEGETTLLPELTRHPTPSSARHGCIPAPPRASATPHLAWHRCSRHALTNFPPFWSLWGGLAPSPDRARIARAARSTSHSCYSCLNGSSA